MPNLPDIGPLSPGIVGAANIARQFTAALNGNASVHVAAAARRCRAR